ncbi:NADPH-dependent FMN reductase [Hamadaea tsunoensis]|uniref:NADPH-dependent FMN reductase n=1 Tax=Hamadaea tsunoensis TaxID=53368 RepID=UPI000404CDB1|nr:NAD(P)H-dependent oxidoreductase [Hamadaea tsunoensis]
MRVLAFAASTRAGSVNLTLAKLVVRVAERSGSSVDFADYADFAVPVYGGDVEAADGIPPGAYAFADRVRAADAFMIVSPEYNASMPGHLKNLIDWVSRIKPQPLWGTHALLASASPRLTGGNRGLWALRVPLEHLGTRVFPEMFSLSAADEAFTESGELISAKYDKRLTSSVTDFLDLVAAVRGHGRPSVG